jgi:hypothetical protein
MTRIFLIAFLSGSISPMAAWGQAPAGTGPTLQPERRPTVSPYLDLVPGIRQGVGYQYYRQLLPQRQFRANDQIFERSIRGIRQDLQVQERLIQTSRSGLTPTGTPSGFLTHDKYFNVNHFSQ